MHPNAPQDEWSHVAAGKVVEWTGYLFIPLAIGLAIYKLPELLRVAIEQTLQLQDVESDAYRAWIKDPAGPFTPSVPAAKWSSWRAQC